MTSSHLEGLPGGAPDYRARALALRCERFRVCRGAALRAREKRLWHLARSQARAARKWARLYHVALQWPE